MTKHYVDFLFQNCKQIVNGSVGGGMKSDRDLLIKEEQYK